MAEEGKGIALTILGIVAVIAVVGLVLLFTGAGTGKYAAPGVKIYGGAQKGVDYPYLEGRKVAGAYGDQYSAQYTQIPDVSKERYVRQIPSQNLGCPIGTYRVSSSDVALGVASGCTASEELPGWQCCDATSEYWSPTGGAVAGRGSPVAAACAVTLGDSVSPADVIREATGRAISCIDPTLPVCQAVIPCNAGGGGPVTGAAVAGQKGACRAIITLCDATLILAPPTCSTFTAQTKNIDLLAMGHCPPSEF